LLWCVGRSEESLVMIIYLFPILFPIILYSLFSIIITNTKRRNRKTTWHRRRWWWRRIPMWRRRVRFRARYGTRWSAALSLRTWQSASTICCWPPLPETTPFRPLMGEGERERPWRKPSWIGLLFRNREGWSKTENLPLGPGNANRFSFFFSIFFLFETCSASVSLWWWWWWCMLFPGLYSWVRVFGYTSRGRECSIVKGRGLFHHTSSFLLIYYYYCYEEFPLSLFFFFRIQSTMYKVINIVQIHSEFYSVFSMIQVWTSNLNW